MIKQFQINDILNAVNSISKIDRKKSNRLEKKNDSAHKNDVLSPNNQGKSTNSEIRVLDQMIE